MSCTATRGGQVLNEPFLRDLNWHLSSPLQLLPCTTLDFNLKHSVAVLSVLYTSAVGLARTMSMSHCTRDSETESYSWLCCVRQPPCVIFTFCTVSRTQSHIQKEESLFHKWRVHTHVRAHSLRWAAQGTEYHIVPHRTGSVSVGNNIPERHRDVGVRPGSAEDSHVHEVSL